MRPSAPECWALWVATGVMAVAAIINLRTLTVPNRLAMPAMLAGWFTASLIGDSADGGILASLAATAISFLMLLPLYASAGLGAGCVKMQMAFGAWVGCAAGIADASSLAVASALLGGAFTAVGMAIARRRRRADSEGAVPSGWFPAQATFSLGSICGVVALSLIGRQ